MVSTSILRYEGHNFFRQRLILATLSNKIVRIDKIRSDEDHPGLKDYEVSFLRLLEKVTNGAVIEIGYTGTTVVYKPGIIHGGRVQHECASTRSIGYYLEPLIALAPFSKHPFMLHLEGITNDNMDTSVDAIRTITLPVLKQFGMEQDDISLKIVARGAPPLGGGKVEFRCPVIRQLKPLVSVDEGRVKRIRGIAYAMRVSPQMANRVVEASRGFLTRFIPDVYVYTDVYKGNESGKSPGYGLTLVAETTTGSLYSSECTFQPRLKDDEKESMDETTLQLASRLQELYNFPAPEDLGSRVAKSLLSEISKGGCFPSSCQWLVCLLMTLCPEDVSKVRFGKLEPFTIQYLRDLKDFFGVTFKIKPDEDTKSVVLTGLGVGYVNVNKKSA